MLGLSPWSPRFFVSFNLFWIALWALSLWALSARKRAALFPLWFLGIASVANGVFHPALAFRAGGYFPGLLTSTFVGVAGGWLLRCLFLLTSRPGRPSAPPARAELRVPAGARQRGRTRPAAPARLQEVRRGWGQGGRAALRAVKLPSASPSKDHGTMSASIGARDLRSGYRGSCLSRHSTDNLLIEAP